MSSKRLSIWNHLRPNRRRGLYEMWVREYATDLYRMAYRLCGDTATAEDLVQETFYHAWKGINGLKDAAKGRAWLHQILRHRFFHWVRDRTRRIEGAPNDRSVDQLVDPEPSALARLSRKDELQAALNHLDESMKTPLLMVFLEGMTCREAAEELDLPLGTVLSRIHRARQKVQAAFAADDAADSSADGKTEGNRSPQLRLRGRA